MVTNRDVARQGLPYLTVPTARWRASSRLGCPFSIVRSISMLMRGSRSSAWKRRAPDDGVAVRATVTSQMW